MRVFPNPNRIQELFTEEKVKRAADKILAYRSKEVLQVIAWAWGIVLLMTFSLLFTVRLALSLPL